MMRASSSHSSAAARHVTTPPQPSSSDHPVSNTRAELYSGVTCGVGEGGVREEVAGGAEGRTRGKRE